MACATLLKTGNNPRYTLTSNQILPEEAKLSGKIINQPVWYHFEKFSQTNMYTHFQIKNL